MDGGRTGRRLGAALLVIGVLSAAGMTACTDDDPSGPSVTTAGPTPAPTPSVTASPPTAPKSEPTPKSAEAFVKYFWDVYNYSYATLDSEPLRSLSEPHCDFCSGVIEETIESQEKNLTNEGGKLTPLVVAAPPGRIRGSIVVSSVLNQEASRVLAPDGQVLHTSRALRAVDAGTRLEWRAGKWTVAAVNIAIDSDKP
jgi:hypothetical protein